MAYVIANVGELEAKSKLHTVTHISGSRFEVISGTSNHTYTVDVHTHTCTCERQAWISDRNHGQNNCSHWMAAEREYQLLFGGYSVKFRPLHADTRHLHRKTQQHHDGVKTTLRKSQSKRAGTGNLFDNMSLDEINDCLFG